MSSVDKDFLVTSYPVPKSKGSKRKGKKHRKGDKDGISTKPSLPYHMMASPSEIPSSALTKGKVKGTKSTINNKSPSTMPASDLTKGKAKRKKGIGTSKKGKEKDKSKASVQVPSTSVPSKAFSTTISPTRERTRGERKGKGGKDKKKGGTKSKGSTKYSSIPTPMKGSKKRKGPKNKSAKSKTKGNSRVTSNAPSLLKNSKLLTNSPSQLVTKPAHIIDKRSANPSRYTARSSPSAPRSSSIPSQELSTYPSHSPSAKVTSKPCSFSPRPTQELSASPFQSPSFSPTYQPFISTVEDVSIPNSSVDIDGGGSSSSGSLLLFATATSVLVLGLAALKKTQNIRRNALEFLPNEADVDFPISLDDLSETM